MRTPSTLLLLSLLAKEVTGQFGPQVPIEQGFVRLVERLVVHDVDQDGDLDPMIWADHPGAYLNLGGDLFSTFRAITPGNHACGVQFDMNGDGSPDLYNLSSGGSEIAIYAGGGQYTITTSNQGSDAVLDNGDIGDLDGDGDLDILSVEEWRFQAMNNGSGVFTMNYDLTTVQALCSELWDMDGDGDLDLVYGNSSQILYRLNDGTGTFGFGQPFHAGGAFDIAFFDVTGDGLADAVFTRTLSFSGPWDITYRAALGNGQWDAPVNLGQSQSGISQMAAADMDADGDTDLVAATSTQVLLFLNTGTNGFLAPDTVFQRSGSDLIRGIATGDVSVDGLADICLVIRSIQHHVIAELRNLGGGQFESTLRPFSVAGDEMVPVIGDLQNDGAPDMLVGQHIYGGGGGFSMIPTDGTGTLLRPTYPEALTYCVKDVMNPSNLQLLDLNGDSLDDLFFTNINSDSVLWRAGNGDGTFGPPVSLPLSGADLAGEVFTDLDLDGDLDIVWNIYSPDIWGWCLNDGSGVFTGCGQQQGLDLPNMFEVADVNGDGYPDVIIAGTYWLQWVANDGNGGFASNPVMIHDVDTDPAYALTNRVRAADLDLDGDNDVIAEFVITGSSFNTRFVLFENSGSGIFSGPSTLFSGTTRCSHVEAVDVDADGDMDISTVGYYNGNAVIHANDGQGDFQITVLVDDSVNYMRWVDMDGDGLLDVVLASEQKETLYWRQAQGLILGSPEPSLTEGILAYPNPARELLTLIKQDGTLAGSVLHISDAQGRGDGSALVANGASIEIDLHDFAPGIYVIYVIEPDGQRTSVRVAHY